MSSLEARSKGHFIELGLYSLQYFRLSVSRIAAPDARHAIDDAFILGGIVVNPLGAPKHLTLGICLKFPVNREVRISKNIINQTSLLKWWNKLVDMEKMTHPLFENGIQKDSSSPLFGSTEAT